MKYYKLKTVVFYIFATTIMSFDLKGSEKDGKNENEGSCPCCNQCCKKCSKKVNYLAPDEKEISFKDYSSENDRPLTEIESTNNLFKYVTLYEYINLLNSFTVENPTNKNDLPQKNQFSNMDEFYQKEISVEDFTSFIDNKIFNLKNIKDLIGNNEATASIFKQICIEIYNALVLKLRQNSKSEETIVVKKKNLIPIGLLFCTCNNIEKIKLFFDLFKNKEDEFCKSEELNVFLLSDFLIASYCLISARNKIGGNNKNIQKIKPEDLLKLISFAELKDNEHLVKVFNDNFFTKEKFTWFEFKQKFKDKENGFGWIFSSQGIRRKLEEHNV